MQKSHEALSQRVIALEADNSALHACLKRLSDDMQLLKRLHPQNFPPMLNSAQGPSGRSSQ